MLLINLFDDNYAKRGSLTGAILLCHVKLSKTTTQEKLKKTNGNAKMNTLHYYHPIQHFRNSSTVLNIASETEVGASGTLYRYNCSRSAWTKIQNYNRKAWISYKRCTRSFGCCQNLLQYLRKSSRRKTQPQRFVLAHYQAHQIRISSMHQLNVTQTIKKTFCCQWKNRSAVIKLHESHMRKISAREINDCKCCPGLQSELQWLSEITGENVSDEAIWFHAKSRGADFPRNTLKLSS